MGFRNWLLGEMPLANYKVGPFVNQNPGDKSKTEVDYFNVTDRKAIQGTGVPKKLAQVLGRSTGFNFNIILLEYDPTTRPKGVVAIGREQEFIQQVRRYCRDNNVPLEGHITFGKNSTTGDILTPWMILHTLGHALFGTVSDLENILKEMYADYHGSPDKEDRALTNFLAQVFQFRSAREHSSGGIRLILAELAHDIVAEYLWHGHIRAQGQWPGLKAYVNELQETINRRLADSVGKIVVDFYMGAN